VPQIRHWLKQVVLAILYYSGALWLFAVTRLRGRIVVLTYHRVIPRPLQTDSFSSPGIVVSPETFELHMRFLRRYMHPICVTELAELVRSGARPKLGTCVVTFDDGWYDNLEHALPILRRFDIPAVLFVATDYIGSGRCFWQERLARQLFVVRHLIDARELLADLGLAEVETMGESDARRRIRDVVTDLKGGPAEVVERLFASLDALIPAIVQTTGSDRFLSWTELAALAADGLVTIGSHAVSHRPLTQLPPEEVGRELVESKRIIEAKLGKDVDSIAYPNGDTSLEVAAIAAAAGYTTAFTTRRGLIAPDLNPLLLPRVNVHEGAAPSTPAFLGRIVGIA
jgi:peptidoglycan/xylan/chitin deacetylase (PgdA/CDA1 family)